MARMSSLTLAEAAAAGLVDDEEGEPVVSLTSVRSSRLTERNGLVQLLFAECC